VFGKSAKRAGMLFLTGQMPFLVDNQHRPQERGAFGEH